MVYPPAAELMRHALPAYPQIAIKGNLWPIIGSF